MKQIQKPIRPRLMNEVSPTFLTHLTRTTTYPTKYTQLYIYSYLSGLFVTSASTFSRASASVDSPSAMLSHRTSTISPGIDSGVSANACMTATYQYLRSFSSAGSSTKLGPYLLELGLQADAQNGNTERQKPPVARRECSSPSLRTFSADALALQSPGSRE